MWTQVEEEEGKFPGSSPILLCSVLPPWLQSLIHGAQTAYPSARAPSSKPRELQLLNVGMCLTALSHRLLGEMHRLSPSPILTSRPYPGGYPDPLSFPYDGGCLGWLDRGEPGACPRPLPGSSQPSLWGPASPFPSNLRHLAFPPRWRSGFGPSACRSWRKAPPSSPIKWTSRYEEWRLGAVGQGTGLFLPHGGRCPLTWQ